MGHSLKDMFNKQIIKAGVMTGTARVVSDVMDLRFKDILMMQVVWTGAATGAFTLEVSENYVSAADANPQRPVNAGNWDTITPNPAIAPAGTGGSQSWQLQTGAAYGRLVYTNATSTGVVNAWATAKSLG
jgi:hypothetical protein